MAETELTIDEMVELANVRLGDGWTVHPVFSITGDTCSCEAYGIEKEDLAALLGMDDRKRLIAALDRAIWQMEAAHRYIHGKGVCFSEREPEGMKARLTKAIEEARAIQEGHNG